MILDVHVENSSLAPQKNVLEKKDYFLRFLIDGQKEHPDLEHNLWITKSVLPSGV